MFMTAEPASAAVKSAPICSVSSPVHQVHGQDDGQIAVAERAQRAREQQDVTVVVPMS
jgi:hypothetical protein